MSATSVGVAPSGECLRSKCRYDRFVWIAGKTVLSPCCGAISGRFGDEVHDEALYKSTFFTFLLFRNHYDDDDDDDDDDVVQEGGGVTHQ